MTDPEEIQKGKLSPAQRTVLNKLQPRSTLPGVEKEEEEPIPRPMSTSDLPKILQDTAYNYWNLVEGKDQLFETVKKNVPEATSDQINQAISEVERQIQHEKAEREALLALDYGVIVAEWEDSAGSQHTLSYQNHPTKGIYSLTKTTTPNRNTRERVDYITSFYLRDIIKNTNPLNPTDITYSLTFQHPKSTAGKIQYEEQLLSDITRDISSNQPGMSDARGRVHAAVSSLIDHQDREGKVIIKSSIPATGFFEDETGKLYHSDYRGFKVKPSEYSRVRTEKSLEVLGKILEFYTTDGDCDHALTAIYFMVGGPLGSIRKAAGKENKILLLSGVPHTGKTILERINCYIWGIQESEGVIGSAKLTVPQLATHLSLTSYPISFDEIRTALSTPTIADLLKSSTTGLMVKERILAKQGFRKQQFYAYASTIMSTNFLPDLYTGLRERIIPVMFTVRNKKREEEAKTFDQYLTANKDSLGYLGAALRRLFTRNWPRVKGLALQDDQVKAGYEILYTLCQQEGIEPPAWLKVVETRFDIEEDDPVQIVCDFMREDFLQRLRNHHRGDEIPQTWSARLDLLKRDNILPPYVVNISDKAISVTNGIFNEMAKKGREIPGGLTGLAEYVNQHPLQTKRIGKLTPYGTRGPKHVPIMREVFYACAEADSSYQDELKYPQEPHD